MGWRVAQYEIYNLVKFCIYFDFNKNLIKKLKIVNEKIWNEW